MLAHQRALKITGATDHAHALLTGDKTAKT